MGNLTDRTVRTLPPGKHEDGEGLRLYVLPGGTRKWVYRYQRANHRREMVLGRYPIVGLREARDLAAKARRQLHEGRDPIDERRSQPSAAPTFTQAAAAFARAHRRGWRNRTHARQWVRSLKAYARPILGSKPVDQITTEDVLKVLGQIWLTRTETASRVQKRIENVLDFATARRWRSGENPARWRGHLDHLLAPPAKLRAVTHHPAMPYQDLPAFLVELRERQGIPARALEFLILTAARSGEVLGATWGEIDLEAAIWTLPPRRTKSGREHRVPLSSAAVGILQALPRLAGNAHCFPGARRGCALSSMALLQTMRALGYGPQGERGPYVPHGFRSSFRDWAGEVSTAPRDVAELALGHAVGDRTETSYFRSDLFEKRRKLMEAWAAWCTPRPANVTPIGVAREVTRP